MKEPLAPSLWFWSDTHFHHANIIDFCNRPFGSVAEMDAAMIERWNQPVKAADQIFFLGDFGFGGAAAETVSFLNGEKHLVIGNHDEKQSRRLLTAGWASISHIRVVKWEGLRIVLCHYPLESWPGMHRGWYHFHGHSHGTLKRRLRRRLDVGFDCFPDGPVSISDALQASEIGEDLLTDGHKREEM